MARATLLLSALVLWSSSAGAQPFQVGVSFSLRDGTHRELAGMLEVLIPLERLAGAKAASPAAESLPVPGPTAVAEQPPEPEPAVERQPARQTERSAHPPAVPRFPPVFARALVKAAVRLHGDGRARERLDGLSTRSRVAALLPELALRAARSNDQSLRLQPAGVDRYELTQTGGADLLVEARATWTLDRLVFADEELRIEQLRANHAQSAERLALTVLKHLFVWQRARWRLALLELDVEARILSELELLEAAAVLDVLTDGLFSRSLPSLGERREPE